MEIHIVAFLISLCIGVYLAYHNYKFFDDALNIKIGMIALILVAITAGVLSLTGSFLGSVLAYVGMAGGAFMLTTFALLQKLWNDPEPIPEKKQEKPKRERLYYERLPDQTRFEHTLIIGGSGQGKTSLIREMIAKDLTEPCSLVIFDSQGDIVNKVLHTDFPRDRVVYIDPTDIHHPISLGLFDFDISGHTAYEREERENTVIELLTFVLNSILSAELTSKQDVLMRYVIRLCLVIPNANIITVRDIFTKGGLDQYQEYIEKLSDSAQHFFRHEFHASDFNQTKQQILRRVYTLLENKSLERIFSSTETKLDMGQALDEGSVILVNSAKKLLKEQGSAFFSRFIVALIYQAVQVRDLSKSLMPTFVYLDEASPIIDSNVGNMLETARKYHCGLILAVQYLGQIDYQLQQSVLTNTKTKYVGGVSGRDAKTLSLNTGIDDTFYMHKPKLSFSRGYDHFWVNWDTLDRMPKRTDLPKLIAENRAKYCTTGTPLKKKEDTTQDDIEDWNAS